MRYDRDIIILFTTRIVRLFAYGFLSIVFALLMVLAGAVFILTRNFVFLIIAAVIGVISPSGNEIGPFLSIEQAALTQLLPDDRRTYVFSWYNLAGSFSTASGALCGGWIGQLFQKNGLSKIQSYRMVLIGYALAGIILALLFLFLSPSVESKTGYDENKANRHLGLNKSRRIVFKLSTLFALDAFAGGFVIQSLIVYWFHIRFGMDTGMLGSIFFGANILAGISALLAARIAARFGLINTMVFTHIPSNILLCLVPLMSFSWLAIAVLLLRFSISQMDVPTRQSYTMAVVSPDERSAASGITTIARSVGASVSPALAGLFLTSVWLMSFPFFIAGGLKIIYDLSLYRSFRTLKPPEET
jgi:predicted MFS family arabinose efflux permease